MTLRADIKKLREPVTMIARRAGDAILEIYRSMDPGVTYKDDDSPLTSADLAAHELIVNSLAELTPGIPVLSEESADIPFAVRSGWKTHWLVDPLDGTREFLARNGEFTVNIALIHEHTAVLGVVGVPALGAVYTGSPGVGADRRSGADAPVAIHVQTTASKPVRVVGSRSHRGETLDAYLAALGAHTLVPVGSALKFCIVAEGGADVYPRLGLTSEWDTAAAQAVVTAAGGHVVTLDGQPLRYNTKESLLNPYFFVYADDAAGFLQHVPVSR